MDLWETLSELIRRDAQHLERIVVPPENVIPAPVEAAPLKADEGYFRLWVREMFLQTDQMWFKTFYPVVQSMTSFQFGREAQPVEITHVAGPGHLAKIDPAHLGQVIQVDHVLMPLAPFVGGTVQIEAGLMRMQADDLLQRLVDVVSSFSGLLAVPQLSTALNVAEAVGAGVEKLLGIDGNRLLLGYQQTFAGSNGGSQLGPTHIVLLNAESGSTKPEHYWVKNGSLHYGADADQATPLIGYDYMLLRLETLAERDDWQGLSAINEPWEKAVAALSQTDASGQPQIAEAEGFVRMAIGAAYLSPDLTKRDRGRIAKAIKEQFRDYRDAMVLDTAQDPDDATLGGPSPEAARPAQPPTLADVAATASAVDATPPTLGALLAD